MSACAFTRLTAGALPLVHERLSRPPVVEWWPAPAVQATQIDAHVGGDDTTPYLVSLEGRPFAETSTITTDPDRDNAWAIRAYEKAGFRRIGLQATPWGRVLLMQRDKPS